MKYRLYVPPTNEQGGYSVIVSDKYQTKSADALQDYNSVRAHDGQRPLRRMPKGTTYTKIVEYVLLADYGQGWEDETTEQTHKEILQRLHEYRDNAPRFAYRWTVRPVED